MWQEHKKALKSLMALVLSKAFFHFQKHHQLFNLAAFCSVALLNNPILCTAENPLDNQWIFNYICYNTDTQTHTTKQIYTFVLWWLLVFNVLLTTEIITQIIFLQLLALSFKMFDYLQFCRLVRWSASMHF